METMFYFRQLKILGLKHKDRNMATFWKSKTSKGKKLHMTLWEGQEYYKLTKIFPFSLI